MSMLELIDVASSVFPSFKLCKMKCTGLQIGTHPFPVVGMSGYLRISLFDGVSPYVCVLQIRLDRDSGL